MPTPPEAPPPWRIGLLSQRTGVSVRALHHYDALGLLKASQRSPAGHRRYGLRDIARLQQILSLRQLGLSLAEISECFAKRRFSARQVVERHLAAARAALSAQQMLVSRLESLQKQLAGGQECQVEEFVSTVEAIIMTEQYFTLEQQDLIRTRRQLVGEGRIRQVEQHEWPTLIADVKAEMDKGTDPGSPVVKALARRWQALVEEFTGRDQGLTGGVRRQYQTQDPNPAQRHGMPLTREMFQYIGRAMKD